MGARTIYLWVGFVACVLVLSGFSHLDSAIGRGRSAGSVTVATSEALQSLPTMLVIGDSYTSGPDVPGMENTDVIGSERRGWWSYLADKLNYRPVLSAEPGSGMLMSGYECEGTTFGDRLGIVKKTRPQIIVVEGGRNDYRYCNVSTSMASGKPVSTYSLHQSSAAAVRTAARTYLKKLRERTDEIGLPADHVYVIAPWGSVLPERRTEITGILEDETDRAGFTFVDIPTLTDAERYDDTHPNGAGSRSIFEHLWELSDIGQLANDRS